MSFTRCSNFGTNWISAYFTKQVGWGYDVVSWSSAKDIARTNYIYRIAKDNVSK